MSRVVQGLADLILAGILAQSYLLAVVLALVYLSRAGDFGAEPWQWQENAGYALGDPILLLMIVTLVMRLRWREIAAVALLGVLFVVQIMLERVQIGTPYIPALYAMNGLAMMGLTVAIDRSSHA